MKLLMLMFVIVCVSCAHRRRWTPAPGELTGEKLRDHINSHQKLWKAKVPERSRMDNVMDIKFTQMPDAATLVSTQPNSLNAEPPANGFDARVQWPECGSIGYIRDQSQCGACWAFAAVELLTDRICIASNGTYKPIISAQDLISCCTDCIPDGWTACDGGYTMWALDYLGIHGASTGSGFYENFGCKPYYLEPCGVHTLNGVTHINLDQYCYTGVPPALPQCSSTCSNSAYNLSYAYDIYYGQYGYEIYDHSSSDNNVLAIQREIMTNGPVIVQFTVYADFDQYTSGIYQHTYGSQVGGHAVRMIGWGTENGVDYWLCVNQWNTNWGENGYFRIIRGVDECGVESGVIATLVGPQYYPGYTPTSPRTFNPTTSTTTTTTITTTSQPRFTTTSTMLPTTTTQRPTTTTTSQPPTTTTIQAPTATTTTRMPQTSTTTTQAQTTTTTTQAPTTTTTRPPTTTTTMPPTTTTTQPPTTTTQPPTTTTTAAPTTTTCAAAINCPAISFDANSVVQGPTTCGSGTWKYVCTSSNKALYVKLVSQNNKWTPVSAVKCMAGGWYINNVLISNVADITQVKCLVPA